MVAGHARRLDGRVAVVTGGASGIGEATVRRFVKEGARVVIADIQTEPGEALAEELGDAVRFARVDVTEDADVAAAVDLAVDTFGTLDVMFNNAGVLGAVGPVASMNVEDFRFTLEVDLVGVFLGVKHAARVMEPRGAGVIVSTASPGGVAGGLGPHAYSAAKAGVIGLTRAVAAELRPKGIRVNAVLPGAVASPMTAAARVGSPEEVERTHELLSETALAGRAVLAEEIAAAVAFLASDDAEFITATELPVDGGLLHAPGTAPYAAPEHSGVMREAGRRGRPTA